MSYDEKPLSDFTIEPILLIIFLLPILLVYWCRSGYNKETVAPSIPVTGDMKCYGCSRKRSWNSSTGDMMDFCGRVCASNTYSSESIFNLS